MDVQRLKDSSGARRSKRKIQNDLNLSPHKRPRNDRSVDKWTEVPEDIFYEVLKNLKPLDIWNLAQVSKCFRMILMSKSSSWVWKASRANVPPYPFLPEPPPCMSEPQYADFMFNEDFCQYCRRRCDNLYVSYHACARSCSNCFGKHFRCVDDKWKKSFQGALEGLRIYVPTIIVSRGGPEKTFYFKDIDVHWKEEYAKATNKLEWVNAKIKERLPMYQNSRSYQNWWDARNFGRGIGNFKHRMRKVEEYLFRRGWADELIMSNIRLNELPAVIKACEKEMTAEDCTKLEKFLEKLLKKAQQQRLDNKYAELFKRRSSLLKDVLKAQVMKLPPNSVYPSVADFYHDSRVNKAVNSALDFTKRNLRGGVCRFPQITQHWKEQKTDELLTLTKKMIKLHNEISSGATLPSSVLRHQEGLDLAIIFFECSSCKQLSDPSFSLRYPEVLMHGGNPHRTLVTSQPASNEVLRNTAWNLGEIAFNAGNMILMAEIVRFCGLNPRTATAADMDLLDPSIKCTICETEDGQGTIRWRDVIVHKQIKHSSQDATFTVNLRDKPV